MLYKMQEATPSKPSEDRQEAVLVVLRARVCGLARRLTGADDAEDIAQQTMIIICAEEYKEKRIEELILIANRVCVNLIKNMRRKKRPIPFPPEVLSTFADEAASPESLAAKAEMRERLFEVLKDLAPRCRKLMKLDLNDASTDVIAAELNVAKEMVYTLRKRCGGTLRKLLQVKL